MILHLQIFKNNISVADFAPTLDLSESAAGRNYNDDCQRLINQVLKKRQEKGIVESDPERTPCYGDGILVFTKNNLQFHTAPLIVPNDNQKFTLMCVTPLTQNSSSRQSFLSIVENLETRIEECGLDKQKLGWSLTKMLNDITLELQDSINSREDPKRGEGDDKLSKIEVELGEIADNVKQNINHIFDRGEKLGMLTSKSEALKANSRTLRSRASKVRRDSYISKYMSSITVLVLIVRSIKSLSKNFLLGFILGLCSIHYVKEDVLILWIDLICQ